MGGRGQVGKPVWKQHNEAIGGSEGEMAEKRDSGRENNRSVPHKVPESMMSALALCMKRKVNRQADRWSRTKRKR